MSCIPKARGEVIPESKKRKWKWGFQNWRDAIILLLAIMLILQMYVSNAECKTIINNLNEDPCSYCRFDEIEDYKDLNFNDPIKINLEVEQNGIS